MKVLVVGGGGREHALAWKLDRSARCGELFVSPGNAGTPGTRLAFGPTDVVGITNFCTANRVDLVVVGPEVSLEAGLADSLAAAGVATFGPSREASRLEWSKSYTRSVASRLGIPSPEYATFTDADAAVDWWQELGRPVVVKFDGLAAGKGVVVPESDEETIDAIRTLCAHGEVVLEERLTGPECSLLALCDGTTARALPIAQDHKRIGEGDTGPNTGGMGAYAPAPIPYRSTELIATFVQPVLDHLAAAGTPYVGVLYAGLMLTAEGPRLIEYNCRFGDPEAQAVLPLIESDLLELLLACCNGTLASAPLRISSGAACTVVAAAAGYPAKPIAGHPITFGDVPDGALVFHAGTAIGDDHSVITAGGRVLSVTGLGADLGAARDAAYAALDGISFHGMTVRRDIAWRAPGARLVSYAAAGVDIDEGNLAVKRLKESVDRTHTPAVLNGIGSFGGALDVSALKEFDRPVLVASTDGVGTKVELAARAGRPDVSGRDIVNHCIDDVLVQGAKPLFFLDYIAAAKLDSGLVASVVEGMAASCEESGCVLLGGETAEMPGVYTEGSFDVAGTLVGVVEHANMLPRPGIAADDVLLGLGSSGPHTNGYSLLRKLFAWIPLTAQPAPLDRPLVDALLQPHRSYLNVLAPVLDHQGLKGLAHITGGGLIENVPRILPDGVQARIRLGSWPVPPLFQLVREVAYAMSVEELHRTLNMGIGMVLVCAAESVEEIRGAVGEASWVIGELVVGERGVVLG
jgi:phosphoribosylamine--glycine ligase/phosphoribosylaminoimidazole synthetase